MGPRPGTARAALASPRYRRVFLGALTSNIGTWMQNVTLAAFAFDLTRSETFVGLVVLAQLGPMLLFTLVGGTLADLLDRRRLLIVVAVQQMAFSLLLAWVVSGSDPSRLAILAVVLMIGIGQSIHAPTFTSVLPTLVPRRDLPGAVSLQSVNMNASRVVGPAIGGVVMATLGVPAVFILNAASYIAIIVVVSRTPFPRIEAPAESSGLTRALRGFAVARADRVVGRCLLTMAAFSFFCLPIATQLPALAERNLGIDATSTAYGLLYATFALGALLGALSIGTVLAGRSLPVVVRGGLAGFAVMLAVFALLRDATPAYPVALLLGVAYFATVTALSTTLQGRLADHERGRVMALWIMAFGGTVPLGGMVFGPVMELTSISAVMLGGALVAAALVAFADLRDHGRPAVARA